MSVAFRRASPCLNLAKIVQVRSLSCDYEQHILWAEYCRMMESLALKIPSHLTELDLPQADYVRIKDPAPIMHTGGDTIELASVTFGFPPSGPKQIVVLQPEDWAAWLNLAKPEAELLRPLPAGSLAVETVRSERA